MSSIFFLLYVVFSFQCVYSLRWIQPSLKRILSLLAGLVVLFFLIPVLYFTTILKILWQNAHRQSVIFTVRKIFFKVSYFAFCLILNPHAKCLKNPLNLVQKEEIGVREAWYSSLMYYHVISDHQSLLLSYGSYSQHFLKRSLVSLPSLESSLPFCFLPEHYKLRGQLIKLSRIWFLSSVL